jgi:hypothetical protein
MNTFPHVYSSNPTLRLPFNNTQQAFIGCPVCTKCYAVPWKSCDRGELWPPSPTQAYDLTDRWALVAVSCSALLDPRGRCLAGG